ncbi:protein phosphatase 1 regulatory subunit 12A isoform X6 [Bicyclus anynana]|uniref:Protein phosphatase 1 regulatory subunit 12A isoform X6 n=1 Tax=Bicyclus anynana TaxID=110368 RepID=A0ABM3M5U1_BICAN|nr:protein phosphatase 1 regulatory subunit 12A isoform X6 [Bicyclus anynana]
MTDVRSSSALFKRAEQLKRWEESDTNKQSSMPKRASRIQFSSEIVFLAACTAGDKDEVLRLLKMGADINTANVDGLTALHQACIDDNLEMVEFLVEHEADVNRGDNEGWTPLHATASCGFLSIARYLIDNGADVAAVNYDGELPLDIADTAKMKDLLEKVIIENGINCHKSRHAEVDALTRDAENWAKNGYVEVRDPKTGGTPLHVAAAKGYYDVAKILLEKCNVEPNCVDYEDWTPLHAAALWGQKDAAELLLKHGADPNLKNYSGQTCLDLVDPSISAWFAKASLEAPRRINNNNNNNNNKRKRSPPRHDVKRVELEITGNTDNVINDKPASAPEIIPKVSDGKPPKGRAPSPESAEPVADNEAMDEAPSWRRSASFRNRQQDNGRDNKPTNNNVDSDTILRRTHSFENDKTTNADRREREVNTWSSPATTSPTAASTTTTQTIRRSFVPPVRDEESETQRKVHAKRVRETRRSTQGVTLDELKSAEQLVKKKAGNGTTEASSPTKANVNSIADSFELEDAEQSSPRTTAPPAAEATVLLRRPPSASTANTTAAAPAITNTHVTSLPNDEIRPSEEEKERESSAESKSSSSPSSTQAALNVIQRRRRPKRRSTGVGHVDMDDIVNDRGGGGEGDGDSENVQNILEDISRYLKRYKRKRSFLIATSGTERTEDGEEKDYKALYEASQSEVRRLRSLLTTSEQQLRNARATIARLSQVNQNSLSEIEKREKRAMERKLSEMEEELKQLQKLKAENERLRAENRALTRVVSKLTNSAAK